MPRPPSDPIAATSQAVAPHMEELRRRAGMEAATETFAAIFADFVTRNQGDRQAAVRSLAEAFDLPTIDPRARLSRGDVRRL